MASPFIAAKNLKLGHAVALVKKLGGMANVKAILRGEKTVKLEDVVTGFSRQMFTPVLAQIEALRQRNRECKLGFKDEHFAQLPTEEPVWSDDPRVVWVVTAYTETEGATFEMYTQWIKEIYTEPHYWRWDKLQSDRKHLRLLEGIKHPGRCLRLEKIHLAAHWDKRNGIRPLDVRSAKDSPHAGVLAAVASFPKWVQAMDGDKVPYVWLPGYEVTVEGHNPWSLVPDVDRISGAQQVVLHAFSADFRIFSWAVPALRE